MIWISHSETVFQVAFSLDATQLLGLALSADRLAAAAVSAPLEALPQAVFFFFCAPPSVRRRLCDAACAPGGRLRAGAHRRAAYALAYALVWEPPKEQWPEPMISRACMARERDHSLVKGRLPFIGGPAQIQVRVLLLTTGAVNHGILAG